MNPTIRERALEMHQEGMSIRQIAQKLGIGKSTVARWIQPVSQHDTNDIAVNTDYDYKLQREIELKKLQLQHELELRRMAREEREQEMKYRELEHQLKSQDLVNKRQEIEARKLCIQIQRWAESELEKQELASPDDMEISEDEFHELNKQVSRLYRLTEDHCTTYALNPDELEIVHNLDRILDKLRVWSHRMVSTLSQNRPELDPNNDWDEDDTENLDHSEPEFSYTWESRMDELRYLCEASFEDYL